jgi:sigma-B regulation protein RsbU (phosphoserine phosphatase)
MSEMPQNETIRWSFRTKLLASMLGVLVVAMASSAVLSLWAGKAAVNNVRNLGRQATETIAAGLTKETTQAMNNYSASVASRIDVLFQTTFRELTITANLSQWLIDHDQAREALGRLAETLPEWNDKLIYQPLTEITTDKSIMGEPLATQETYKTGDWRQTPADDASVLSVWGYLLEPGPDRVVRADVMKDVRETACFDFYGPAILKSGNPKLQVYQIGAPRAPIMRLTPWLPQAQNFDRLYPGHNTNTFWPFYFDGCLQSWDEWASNPASVPVPGEATTVSYPYQDACTGNEIVTYFYPLWSKDRKSSQGAVAIDVTLEQTRRLINDVKIANTGFAFLATPDGNVVAAPLVAEEILGLTMQKGSGGGVSVLNRYLAKSTQPAIKTLKFPGPAGYTLETCSVQRAAGQKEDYIMLMRRLAPMNYWAAAGAKVERAQWMLGMVVPKAELFHILADTSRQIEEATAQIEDATNASVKISLSLLLAFLALGVLVARGIANSLGRGLKQVYEAVKLIALKDYAARCQIKTNDEIGQLGRAFNNMAASLAEAERLREDNSRMAAELNISRRLQQMILPDASELEAHPDLDLAAYMEPAEEVGGDYYDVIFLPDQHVKIGIGDVTGHGLESGALMLQVQAAVNAVLNVQTLGCQGVGLAEHSSQQLCDMLSATNRMVCTNTKRMGTDKNLTMCYLDYHLGKWSITGQHEEVLVFRGDGRVERIDTQDLGISIGLVPEAAEFFHLQEVLFNPGDVLVVYTDGITEADDGAGNLFGVERIIEVAREARGGGAKEIRDAIIAAVRQHIGSAKVWDDITLVVSKHRGK